MFNSTKKRCKKEVIQLQTCKGTHCLRNAHHFCHFFFTFDKEMSLFDGQCIYKSRYFPQYKLCLPINIAGKLESAVDLWDGDTRTTQLNHARRECHLHKDTCRPVWIVSVWSDARPASLLTCCTQFSPLWLVVSLNDKKNVYGIRALLWDYI